MKNKFLTVILFTIFSVSLSAQTKTDYKPTLDLIFKAFKEKNYDLIKPLLDPNVKIGDFPTGHNDAIIPQMLTQLPNPNSYSITGTAQEGENVRVSTIYTSDLKPEMKRSFLFNKEDKIIDFDVMGGLKGSAQQKKIGGKFSTGAARFEIPFTIQEGIIYIKAKLNGKEETFILDSGAPTLVLNSDSKSLQNVTKAEIGANGVGGKVANTGFAHIDSFNWNGIEIKNSDMITMPLNQVARGKDCIGLIGYQVFKDYQLTFDYKNKKIIAVLNSDPDKQIDDYGKLLTTIPFEMKRHIPVFDVEIGGKKYKMGLDTGASNNLFSTKYSDDLKALIKGGKKAEVVGASASSVKAIQGKVKTVTAGNIEYKNMAFVFEDSTLDQLNGGYQLGIDGLLGYEFLKSNITTVDFAAKEIRVYSGKK